MSFIHWSSAACFFEIPRGHNLSIRTRVPSAAAGDSYAPLNLTFAAGILVPIGLNNVAPAYLAHGNSGHSTKGPPQSRRMLQAARKSRYVKFSGVRSNGAGAVRARRYSLFGWLALKSRHHPTGA